MKINAKSFGKKNSLFDQCGKLYFDACDVDESKFLTWLLKAFESGVLFDLSQKLDPKTGESRHEKDKISENQEFSLES